jgi:hypothetical protein
MRLRLFGTAFVLLLALAGTATIGAAQAPVYQAP